MDAEIVAAHQQIDQQAILRLDQRIDALEEALRSATDYSTSLLTAEQLENALQSLRAELAAQNQSIASEAQVAEAEARVAEAEQAEAEALETVAMLELEEAQALDEEEELAVPVEEVTVEEPSEEGTDLPTPPSHRIGFGDLGMR